MSATHELSTGQRVGVEVARAAAFVALGATLAPGIAHAGSNEVVLGGGNLVAMDVGEGHVAQATHSHSTISPQHVLNKIHHYAVPGEAWKPSQKAWVRPTSAYVRPWTINFETDCGKNGGPGSWGNYYSFKYYTLSRTGLSAKVCSLEGITPTAEDNGFSKQLHKLGDQVQDAVGLGTQEHATYVGGNRRRVVAKFNGTATEGVLKIIIYKGGRAEVDQA
jgi:hypothetical protein